MNRKGQLGFGFGKPKKKRVTPAKSEKNDIWDGQKGNCYLCKEKLSPTTSEYHHKDGNPSNWKLSNLAIVCVMCHKKETNKQRVKKVQKRRRQKERIEKDPLGLRAFKAPARGKEPNLFGGEDIFGHPKKKKGKKERNSFF